MVDYLGHYNPFGVFYPVAHPAHAHIVCASDISNLDFFLPEGTVDERGGSDGQRNPFFFPVSHPIFLSWQER